MKKLPEIRAALVTSLCVIVLAQIVLSLVMPLVPIIVTALVVVGIGGYLYHRQKKL